MPKKPRAKRGSARVTEKLTLQAILWIACDTPAQNAGKDASSEQLSLIWRRLLDVINDDFVQGEC